MLGLSLASFAALWVMLGALHFGTGFLLYQASEDGNTRMVTSVLDLGADPNATDGEFGITALMAAAQNGHSGAVSALLRRKAALNASDEHGLTAYQIVANFNHPETASIIKSGRPLNMSFPAGRRRARNRPFRAGLLAEKSRSAAGNGFVGAPLAAPA